MERRIEFRENEVVTIQDVFGKPLIQRITHGWHILFTDADGHKRFGYVLKVDLEQRQFFVLDDVVYPNAPSPIGAQGERVPFDAVMIAASGFNWLRDEQIYEAGKRIGKRQVAMLLQGRERDAEVGWLDRRAGRVYVDRVEGKWRIRI
jgi:hypothetical protein